LEKGRRKTGKGAAKSVNKHLNDQGLIAAGGMESKRRGTTTSNSEMVKREEMGKKEKKKAERKGVKKSRT